MFRTILRRELQDTCASSTLISIMVALTILVPLSAHIQARYYQRVVADYALRQNIHRIENSGQAIVLMRPLQPLLPLFNGAYDVLPDEFRLRSDSATINRPSGDLMPLDWLFPKIDLGFIIGVLMTLLTILLAHDSIAGDRKQGALKFILACPVRRRTVLAAKLMGIVLPIIVCLIYVILLYATMVTVFSGGTVELSSANLSALVVLTMVSILVLIVIAALGVAISTSVRHSSGSLFVCASVWIVMTLLWPILGPHMAPLLKPAPVPESARRDVASKERELIEVELAEHRKNAAELKVRHVEAEDAWRRYLELRHVWTERREEEVKRILGDRKRQIHNQQAFARRISLLSPYVAFKEVLSSLCGTGLESYDEFLVAVEQYRQQEFIPQNFDLLSRQKPWLNAAAPEDRLQLPALQVPPQTLLRRLAAAVWPLSILIIEMVILMTWSFVSFERYDVRV